MPAPNLVLVAATYGDDPGAAAEDFRALEQLGDAVVVAAVVLRRDESGAVEVTAHAGGVIAAGATVGAVGGFVVGLFAPPLLLASVVGAGVGAGVAALVRRHEERSIGVQAEDWLPPGSSAVVAVVDDQYFDRVDAAMAKASRKIDRAIEKGDYEAVIAALDEGGETIVRAVES